MERDVDDMRNIGVTPVEKILEYDGLGFLKAIIDGTLPKPPIADLLGFDIVEAETGKAVFEGLPEFKHYNPIGVVHGGLALTLLELVHVVLDPDHAGERRALHDARGEGEPGARDHQGHGPRARDRAADPSRPHHRHGGRRHPRQSRQPARARHHDVRDFPGEER